MLGSGAQSPLSLSLPSLVVPHSAPMGDLAGAGGSLGGFNTHGAGEGEAGQLWGCFNLLLAK